MIMAERFPLHCQVSLSEDIYAEVAHLAHLDDRSESATIRLALTVLRQQYQQQPQPNGRQQPQEHHP